MTLPRSTNSSHTQARKAFDAGRTALQRKDFARAAESFRRAASIDVNNVRYRLALADALYLGGANAAALPEYLEAARLEPSNVTAWSNAGAIFQQLGQPQQALGALHRALAIDPQHPGALCNSGLAFFDVGEFGMARECLTLASQIKPDYTAAHWNRAILDLLHGDYERGWEGHEYRSVQLARLGNVRTFPEPRWNGERFDGKRLLLWPEQGLGDQLQFVRFIPRVKTLGGTVVLACAAPLQRLFREQVPDADEVVVVDTPYEKCDLQAPLMSLPFILQLGAELDAERVPYLHARGPVKESIASLTGEPAGNVRVGLVWAGQPKHLNDRNRSVRLDAIDALFDIDWIDWYSLQKGETAEAQLDEFNAARRSRGAREIVALGRTLNDFCDTTHAVAAMDLVISVDTAVAHLAGSMNVPTWIMLPFHPDWRWQLQREDSPWYPSVRLFRQPAAGDWPAAVRRLCSELQALATHHAS